jgi:polyhydroxyalkanoate synthesis regulator phasin
MADIENPVGGPHSFFAAWLLLHEKADDWLKDAIRRANETPGEARKEYQNFLLSVDKEKEYLKSIFSEALVCEFRHLGFLHQEDISAQGDELRQLKERLRAMEDQLSRLKEKV